MITQPRKQEIIDDVVLNIEEIQYREFVQDSITEAMSNGTSVDEVKSILLEANVFIRPSQQIPHQQVN